MTTQLIDKLRKSLQQDSQIATDSNLIVAVSGGADSLALLHALAALREPLSIVIHAATLNHGLRESAAGDVTFVRETAETLQIPTTTGQVNVRELARAWKMSIETAARHARYHFLAGVAQQVGANTIVTAHHAGDQAETVLMHILRGSGLNGLQGMAYSSPVPDYPKLRLIRPMLNITRTEIESYCAEHGLQFRHDETNDDTSLLRNKIRLEILPHLAQMNPNIGGALTRLADIVRVEQDYIQQQFEREVLPHIHEEEYGLSLSLSRFRQLHPALQRQFMVYAVEKGVDPLIELRNERIQAAVGQAVVGHVGQIIQMGQGVQLRLDYDLLVVELDAAHPARGYEYEMPQTEYLLRGGWQKIVQLELKVPGVSAFIRALWSIRSSYEPHENFQAHLAIPENAEIIIRTRQPGDRFKPLGMGGKSQKLKDWLVNHKVPQPVRDFLPLLVINGEIAAVILQNRWVIAETFAVRENLDRIVYLSVINAVDISEQS